MKIGVVFVFFSRGGGGASLFVVVKLEFGETLDMAHGRGASFVRAWGQHFGIGSSSSVRVPLLLK